MLIPAKATRRLLLTGCLIVLGAEAQIPATPSTASKPAAASASQPSPKQQAWNLLRDGARSQKTDERTTAVRVLSLLRGQPEAVAMARKALADSKPPVRTAAAMTLGQLRASSTIPQLKNALSDKEVSVVLAAAHSLLLLKDRSAYEVYYAILTGQRKGGPGLVSGQMDTLKDAKKMALLGFQEGIGFIPFAGMGYSAVRTILKDDTAPVRAAAARVLGDDPDPKTAQGLAEAAVGDKNELVRAAALEALARHGDPAFVDRIVPALSDSKDPVKYTAAAVIVRLTAIAERREPNPKAAEPSPPNSPH
jgi:HEAT repeat protein